MHAMRTGHVPDLDVLAAPDLIPGPAHYARGQGVGTTTGCRGGTRDNPLGAKAPVHFSDQFLPLLTRIVEEPVHCRFANFIKCGYHTGQGGNVSVIAHELRVIIHTEHAGCIHMFRVGFQKHLYDIQGDFIISAEYACSQWQLFQRPRHDFPHLIHVFGMNVESRKMLLQGDRS